MIRTPAAASSRDRASGRPPAVEREGGPRMTGTGRQLVRRPRPRQVPERVEPGPDVAAPVAADDPLVAADSEHDAAPSAGELVGDLVTARPRADDEHAAGRQPLRRAVTRRVQLLDPLRRRRGERRHRRRRSVARGEHDVARAPSAAGRADVEAARRALDPGHARPFVHRRLERAGVAVEGRGELGARHVRVRLRRRVVKRQPVRPVGRQERERIPALAAPPLSDDAALEQDVVVAGLREQAAESKPRLPRADDEGLDGGHGR